MNTATIRSGPSSRFPDYSARQNHHHIDFHFHAPDAKQVFLAGDFNRWQPTACLMQRMPDGGWLAGVELSQGYHQYLFLVDGQPMLDPNSSGTVRNDHNERVSLIAVS
jgi:1,4-alpha-glucan branching enzyme